MNRNALQKGVHYTFDFDRVLTAIMARDEAFLLKMESVIKTTTYQFEEEVQAGSI